MNNKLKPKKDFLGPVLFAAFVIYLLYTGGVDSVVRFVKEYLGFLGELILGCLVFGVIIGSVMYVFDKTEKRSGQSTAAIVMYLYVLIGLPLVFQIVFQILDIFFGLP